MEDEVEWGTRKFFVLCLYFKKADVVKGSGSDKVRCLVNEGPKLVR